MKNTEPNDAAPSTAVRQEVVASLEGARIVIRDSVCFLDQYHYGANCWKSMEQRPWPLSQSQADRWLEGWNRVDRFEAFNLLVSTAAE